VAVILSASYSGALQATTVENRYNVRSCFNKCSVERWVQRIVEFMFPIYLNFHPAED
jgi:hypothetical protein